MHFLIVSIDLEDVHMLESADLMHKGQQAMGQWSLERLMQPASG